MKTVWVFDIDSTIANNNHRASLLKKKCLMCLHEPMPQGHHIACTNCGSTSSTITQESWDAFLDVDLVSKDTPIPGAITVLEKLRQHGGQICFLTGRNRRQMGSVTEAWLREHAGWDSSNEPLYMRESVDEDISASVYKERALMRLKEAMGEDCLYIFFEDDPHVFNVYNKHGLVIKCPEAWQHFVPAGAHGEQPIWSR